MNQVNANFDTLAAARQLKAGGFDDNQVAALVKVMQISGESSVTKSDLFAMDASLRGEIQATAAELRGEIASTKAELRADMNAMANKMLLSQLAVAGLLFAAIKTFT